MRRHNLLRGSTYTLSSSLLAALVLCGCNRSDVDDAEPELPAWLTEDEPRDAEPSITLVEGSSSSSAASEQTALRLSLQPGDRFPLRKVVEQELSQSALSGVPEVSRSTLELMMTINVEEVATDRQRMRVRYDRVRYAHDVAGETVEYDSAIPQESIPAAALAYHGMVNDGFAFELGADRRIVGVIGFREFLERCLQHVPAEHRQRVMQEIESNSGEHGIANFVDNTIGVLPADVDKSLGESWERSQQLGRPVPMHLRTVYTLQGIDDRVAKVGVAGIITPSAPLGEPAGDEPGVKITVQGGRTEGRCTLYRDSGLPKESRVERTVDMTVQLAGGIEFTQQKRTVTTVETTPAQSHQAVSAADRPATRFQ